MKPVLSEEADTLPFLTTLSTPRTGTDELPGKYDSTTQVWMVNTPEGAMPIISASTTLAELATKTKVMQEQDDPGAYALLEGATKTFAEPERDDVGDADFRLLLELATKTETVPERDD
jgi:hypothetical protein